METMASSNDDVKQVNKEQVFKSFTSAAKAYFGLKPEEDLRGFMDECRALSPDDKTEIAEGMKRHGIMIQL